MHFTGEHIVNQTWLGAPVLATPDVYLSEWSAFVCNWGDKPVAPSTHLVGYRSATGKSRTSSAVLSFDPETRRAITASGKVYELVGAPNPQSDARFMRSQWFSVNGGAYLRDATDEFVG